MSGNKTLEEMTSAEIAALDSETDKKQDVTTGPLLKVKRLLTLKTNIQAGTSIVGLKHNAQ